MSRLESVKQNSARRATRVRTTLRGNSTHPRLSVHISNRNVSAQIIDDVLHKTLVGVTSAVKTTDKLPLTKIAETVGAEIAAKAKAKKIKKVAFDRGSKLYHGRIKALAEAARKGGLEF